MPQYKLTYFAIQGLAEPIRFILSYKGVDFEDVRIKRDDWPNIKPNTPFGKLPMLEVDGKVLHQSTSICRYLGKEFGLAGSNNWESLQIDIAIDTLLDFRQVLMNYRRETDEEAKAKILDEAVPSFLKKFDELVKNNGGYVANGKLSWGDLYFISTSDFFKVILQYDVFEKYDNLRQLKEKVTNLPKIKEWIEKRPPNEF